MIMDLVPGIMWSWFLLLLVHVASTAWQDGVPIPTPLRRDELNALPHFEQNSQDGLKLLRASESAVVIGARNALFYLRPHDLSVLSVLNWTVTRQHQEECQWKGQEDWKCHNYITSLHGPFPKAESSSTDSKERYLVCGTNAFKPRCRVYFSNGSSFDSSSLLPPLGSHSVHSEEFVGVGYSTFDPLTQHTSILHKGEVYSATVGDFGGADSLIYKKPLRTEIYYDRQLNGPTFLSSYSYENTALFFFREKGLEFAGCGEGNKVVSRVARICAGDQGAKKQSDRFTTFLKARLNCSVPGEFPFFFDHLQGTSEIFRDRITGEQMIYGVFTTPPNSIGASAVCAFSLKDILAVFDGPFKGQVTLNSNWLPVPKDKVPQPRPATCNSDTEKPPMDASSYAFVRKHALMDEAAQGTLLMTIPSNDFKLRTIEVHQSEEFAPRQILYLGTDSGSVLKAVVENKDRERAVISQSWQLFPPSVAISKVKLLDSSLLVVTNTESVLMPITNCGEYKSCRRCISMRDPHCGWDLESNQCVEKNPTNEDKRIDEQFIQDLQTGDTNMCPSNGDDKQRETNEGENEKSNTCPCPSKEKNKESILVEIESNAIPMEPQGKFYVDEEDSVEENSYDNEIQPVAKKSRNDQFSESENEIPYARESSPEGLERGSVVAATLSSALLCLLMGFLIGFLSSRWLAARASPNTKKSGATTTIGNVSLNESQRLTSPQKSQPDFVVNVPTLKRNSSNVQCDPISNNKTTVKKVYI